MDIVITGANGAVGRALIRRLGAARADSPLAGARLRALVRSLGRSAHLRDLPAELIEVDYGDPASLGRAARGADCLVHLAGSLSPGAGDSLFESNLLTTRNIVEAGLAGGAKSFVYLSFPGADPEAENEYLRTKGQAEKLILQSFKSGAIFRVPMILGPDTPAMNQIRKLLRSPVIPLIGGGMVRVQPVYLGDVLGAAEWALLHPDAPLKAMNLAGPDTLPYAEVLRRAGSIAGRSPKILPVPRGPGRAAVSLLGRLAPSLAMSRTVFDIIFYEHLCDDTEARDAMSLAATGVGETLRLSLPQPE